MSRERSSGSVTPATHMAVGDNTVWVIGTVNAETKKVPKKSRVTGNGDGSFSTTAGQTVVSGLGNGDWTLVDTDGDGAGDTLVCGARLPAGAKKGEWENLGQVALLASSGGVLTRAFSVRLDDGSVADVLGMSHITVIGSDGRTFRSGSVPRGDLFVWRRAKDQMITAVQVRAA
jgi:hypothetical protein